MVNTMTTKQSDFLVRLVAERDTTQAEADLEALRQHYREGQATSKEASTLISWLLQSPKKADTDITPGIYEAAESLLLYRAYLGQNSGKMLCKRVVFYAHAGDLAYEYAGAASRFLQGARRLTREEVAERTLSYGSGTCMICGRRLDDPTSVDRGVGPVCWENYA